jgi:hypothetical protein
MARFASAPVTATNDASTTPPAGSRCTATSASRCLTMMKFLNAFLVQPALRLTRAEELDTRMQPWRPASTDGRVIPCNIAITAQAITEPDD